MKHNFKQMEGEDRPEDNRPELIEQTEKLYFFLSNNLTKEAKSVVWDFLRMAKKHYADSHSKRFWNDLLLNFQNVINDFENDLPDRALLKLYGLQKNAREVDESEEHPETQNATI